MAVNAIAFRPALSEFDIVREYYAAARREPTTKGRIPVDRCEAFKHSFFDLAESILNSKRSRIVIVSNGNPYSGLLLPVTTSTAQNVGEVMAALVMLVDALDKSGGSVDASAAYYLNELAGRAGIVSAAALQLA